MQDNLNGITNLDYTIELDGTEYNITAADSLNADVARRTREALNITLSKLPMTAVSNKEFNPTKIEFDFDGHFKQSTSVVPSDGGVFTGNIAVPSISNEEENNYYAINLDSLNGIVKELKGFPTYIWNGELINVTIENEYSSFAPFRVVFYGLAGTTDNDPGKLRFSNTEGYIECYFLAINMSTGWMSVGHCYKSASKDTTYTNLRVQKVDYAKTISQYHPTTDVPINTSATNENRPFDHGRLLDMEKHLDNLGGNEESTDGKTVIEKIHIAITEIDTEITNINNQVTNLNNHANDTGIHRRIVPGYADVSDVAFSSSTFNNEKSAAVIGDIYIKIES